MRRIWWIPAGDDPQKYVDKAKADEAEIMEGPCAFIRPYLKGDNKTARLIFVPTIVDRFWLRQSGQQVGKFIALIYDNEEDTKADVKFRIEYQDLATKAWAYKETIAAARINEWTQVGSVSYDKIGYYRAVVLKGAEPIAAAGKLEFFFHE